mgnify:CR=1 FL=1
MSYLRQTKQVSSAGIEPLIGTFGEQVVGSKFDDISVNFVYPFYNDDFDLEPAVLTGDGAVSVADSEIVVSSASSGSAYAASKDKVRYREGHTGYADFTALFGASGIGEAGCVDSVDGFFIRSTSGVMSVGIRRNSVDTFEVSQASWTGDDAVGLVKNGVLIDVIGEDGSVAIRICKDPFCKTLIKQLSFPIAIEEHAIVFDTLRGIVSDKTIAYPISK